MSYCTSCGESLAPGMMSTAPPPTGSVAPDAPMSPIAAAAPAPRGPVGKVQEPWLVIILTFVTFGIYGFFYWWRVSKEIDAYRGTPGHAFKPIRIGAIVGAIGGVLMLVLWISFMSALLSSDFAASGAEPTDEDFAAVMGSFAFFPLVFIAVIVAVVFWYVGQWRVWSGIEAEERARNHPKPLSPGLQLVFVLVPYLNIVTLWIALYKTQDRLNALWTGRPPTP